MPFIDSKVTLPMTEDKKETMTTTHSTWVERS